MGDGSIYAHIASHVPPQGPGLLPDGWALPDDDEVPSHLRWPPGGADGMRVLLGTVERDDDKADEVSALVLAAVRTLAAKDIERLDDAVRGTDVVSYVDPLLDLVPRFRAAPERVYELGRRLVTSSGHRATVKLGISLFGFFEAGRHVDALLTIGRHDEFTLYAVRALARGLGDAESSVWKLARITRGWGRVHAVRRLAGAERSDAVQYWMLRDGFRNDIGTEAVALPIVVAARLADRLDDPDADDRVVDGAAWLLCALMRRGAPEGIDRYPDGARATTRFVDILATGGRRLSPVQVTALAEIERYVARDGGWWEREAVGWTAAARHSLYTACGDLLARPSTAEAVVGGLASADDETFRAATEVAARVGIDARPALLHRVRARPLDEQAWQDLTSSADDQTIGDVVAAAADCLPLADIATGPASALATSPEYRAHACLDAVLSALGRWPGRGWPLVRAGLSSPVVRNRNLAVAVLERWGRSAWPPDAGRELEDAAGREPEVEVKRRIESLLAS
jgi:hypothetical protein